MPDQPQPRTVESGPVTLQAATAGSATSTTDESATTEDPSGDSNHPGETSPDEGEFVSIEELKKMDREALLKFCDDNQLDVPVEAKNDAQDLLDWLLSEFGVDA